MRRRGVWVTGAVIGSGHRNGRAVGAVVVAVVGRGSGRDGAVVVAVVVAAVVVAAVVVAAVVVAAVVVMSWRS